MKTASVIIKILIAIVAVAGLIFVIATYGDKIVSWAKKFLNKRKGTCECDCDDCDCDDCDCEDVDFDNE